jgi:H+/Cl- antiporter ClcA
MFSLPERLSITRWVWWWATIPRRIRGGEPEIAWPAQQPHPFYPWLLVVVPTIGGLVSGALVFTLAPEAEGHGTDSVIGESKRLPEKTRRGGAV